MSQSNRESDVFNYLNSLAEVGEPVPPLRKIRSEVGGGSLSTISRAVQLWSAQHNPEGVEDSDTEFPASLDDATMRTVFDSIWRAFRPHLNARLAAQKISLRSQLSHSAKELAEVKQALAMARSKISDLEASNKELQEALKKEKEARLKTEGALEALKTYIAAK